jgi:tRNA A-37 threonylcarbamoyl transferase component Bud32
MAHVPWQRQFNDLAGIEAYTSKIEGAGEELMILKEKLHSLSEEVRECLKIIKRSYENERTSRK